METGEMALAVRKWSFKKRPWALMCPGSHASIADYDTFVEWLCTTMRARRREVMRGHKTRMAQGIPVQYPLVRVQYACLERGAMKVSYREGFHGMGVSYPDLESAACASAAIPIVFESQG